MPNFRNVIFDLDGVIVDTEPLYRRAVNLVLTTCAVDYDYTAEEYGPLFTGRSVFENSEYIRERFGLPQTAAQIRKAVYALYELLISDANNLEPMPGVLELLSRLRGSNLRLAIASGAPPPHIEIVLRGMNLQHQFNARVGNAGDLKPKPAPAVYLKALDELNARAAETLALEDSSSGVRAAHAAGIFVIAVPNAYTARQDFSAANQVVENMFEAGNYLRTILRQAEL